MKNLINEFYYDAHKEHVIKLIRHSFDGDVKVFDVTEQIDEPTLLIRIDKFEFKIDLPTRGIGFFSKYFIYATKGEVSEPQLTCDTYEQLHRYISTRIYKSIYK